MAFACCFFRLHGSICPLRVAATPPSLSRRRRVRRTRLQRFYRDVALLERIGVGRHKGARVHNFYEGTNIPNVFVCEQQSRCNNVTIGICKGRSGVCDPCHPEPKTFPDVVLESRVRLFFALTYSRPRELHRPAELVTCFIVFMVIAAHQTEAIVGSGPISERRKPGVNPAEHLGTDVKILARLFQPIAPVITNRTQMKAGFLAKL
jgi:hypothetical protein